MKYVSEDLRNWFSKTHPKGDWVRIGLDGEIKGPCAREEGEGKPKCLNRSRAESMTKEERAKAARRKRRKDPVADRKGKGGKPVNVKTESYDPKELEKARKMLTGEQPEPKPGSPSVKTYLKMLKGLKAHNDIHKGPVLVKEEYLIEKNVPTNPKLWSQAKALAKKKFDVYPCVPLDSEAITREGLKCYSELSLGEEILTYNIKNDCFEWQPIEHLHYYENAPLKKIYKKTGFSVRATENHKWVVRRGNNYQTTDLVETKNINKHMHIVTGSQLNNESKINLFESKWSKKDNWVQKILSFSKEQREIFLGSSIVYDGWDHGGSTRIKNRHTFGFSQKNNDHFWATILSAYLNGYHISFNKKTPDITSATIIRNKKTHNTQNLIIEDTDSEDVWCPTTKNETWVMVQNGFITITGNSAYANGWASKWYKKKGGGWKTLKEERQSTMKTTKDLFLEQLDIAQYGHIVEKDDGKDHEYEMARSQLKTSATAIKRLMEKLGKGEGNLQAWVQSKLTKASDYIDSVADYMDAKDPVVKEAVELSNQVKELFDEVVEDSEEETEVHYMVAKEGHKLVGEIIESYEVKSNGRVKVKTASGTGYIKEEDIIEMNLPKLIRNVAAAGMMAVAAASPVKAANKPIEPLTSKERYSRPVHSAIFKNIINSDRTPKELSDTLFKKGPVRTKHNGVPVIAKQDIEDGNKIHLHHPITGEHTGTITRPSE